MALDAGALASALQGVLTTQVEVPIIGPDGKQISTRMVQATPDANVVAAFCSALIDHIVNNAEITMPNLPVEVTGSLSGSGSASGNTSSGGDPSHSHSFSSGVSTTVPINIATFADTSGIKGTIE